MIVVIGCGAEKLEHRAPARRLYTGTLFRDHLKLAEALRPRAIFVVSAQYGLIPIDQEIDTYERKVDTADEAWAKSIAAAVDREAEPRELVVVLAGKDYSRWRAHSNRRCLAMFEGCTLTERRAMIGKLTNRQGVLL